MPLVKIKTKGQITIPKPVREKLGLSVGDWLEVDVQSGRGVFMPRRIIAAAPAPKLSSGEQKALASAEQKIKAINEDVLNSTGLTRKEAEVAAKAGLIDPDQKYWWMEDWQKRHRQAEQDDQAGRFEEFDTPEAFLNALPS